MAKPSNEEVIQANVELHSRLASSYNQTEPHFRPENVAEVEERLRALARETGGGALLDMGCGTGFIIHLAAPHFKRIVGVDVTQAMLDRVPAAMAGCNIRLMRCDATHTGLPEASFDVCTAYSFLHHLADVQPVVAEAARVLRRGGVFYSALDPNYYAWEAIRGLNQTSPPMESLSAILRRELDSVLKKDEEVMEKHGIARETLNLAEYQKAFAGGLREEALCHWFRDAGFASVRVRHEWYLGQGMVLHGCSAEAARQVEDYLRQLLPLSRHLFKYVAVCAVR